MSDPVDDLENPDDLHLARLIAAVADGANVDWGKAEMSAADPEQRSVIRQLGILALLGKFRGTLTDESDVAAQSGLADAEVSSSPAPAHRSADVPAPLDLASWGPLAVREKVGSGTFGTVYRAWDTALEREVALKLLHKVPSAAEKTVVDEARLLARIHHSNVVTIFGADRFDGRVGFWMEFVSGRTLKEIQEKDRHCSAQEAILFGLDLCRALAAVHQAGFLHCDVKAQNVMREAGGRIVLMDFGAAALMSVGAEPGPRTAGTPLYLAPEVLQGAAATVQSDLYSLGVLLYYLVSGDFPVTSSSVQEMREAHASGRRKLLRDARPDLPPAFVHVIDQATAVLPEARPDSAGAMERLLENAAGRSEAATGQHRRRRSERGRSIAVLPFIDMSPGKSLDYFCDGIAEEITDALTKVPGLRVVARGSAFRFKGTIEDVRQVGSMLNVGTVLEGSVRVSANRLRVISRLIDAVDGGQLWSHRFDRDLDDVFVVQEEIATAAVSALEVRLHHEPGGDMTSMRASDSHDLEAYTMYLKGRHYWNQRTEAALHKSAAYFQAAVEKEPDYAEAYAGLAETYATLGLYGVSPPHEIMPKARTAAERAIAIAGTLSSPHATSGCIAAVYDWAWHDAETHYRRAIELNPNHPAAHHWYAINYLVPLNRFDEAREELRRAVDADPLSMPVRVSLGLLSYFAHRFGDAQRELRDSLELDAGSGTARLFLGLTLVEMARHDEAVRELDMAIQLSPSPEKTAALGYAFARAGHVDRARQALGELVTMSSERYISPSLIAQVHAALGETSAALESLEKASEAHALDLAWLGVRPVFDGLRSEPRFKAVVAALDQ